MCTTAVLLQLRTGKPESYMTRAAGGDCTVAISNISMHCSGPRRLSHNCYCHYLHHTTTQGIKNSLTCLIHQCHYHDLSKLPRSPRIGLPGPANTRASILYTGAQEQAYSSHCCHHWGPKTNPSGIPVPEQNFTIASTLNHTLNHWEIIDTTDTVDSQINHIETAPLHALRIKYKGSY